MKRRFLVFPDGITGVALLLLRISVGISLAVPPLGRFPPHFPRGVVLDVLALALVIGLFTRTAALVSVAIAIGLAIATGDPKAIALIGFALPATALAMIGPGAASIDARLFGRRKISLPR